MLLLALLLWTVVAQAQDSKQADPAAESTPGSDDSALPVQPVIDEISNKANEITHHAEQAAFDVWNYQLAVIEKSPITVGTIVLGVMFLILGVFLSRWLAGRAARTLERRLDLDLSVRHTIQSLSFYFLLIITTLFAMRMANLPITIFTVIGGALAIGIGFGSQNIVNNFISGLILMIERPVKVGDFIQMEGVQGQVVDIGMRSTVIRSLNNQHYIVPNSSFLERNVLNWTHRQDENVRITINVGLAYGSDTAKAAELLKEVARAEKTALNREEPQVYFTNFGDNCLDFELWLMIRLKSMLEKRAVESRLRFAIDAAFRDADIVIAFPQRDVHLDTLKPLDVRVVPQGAES